MISQLGGLRILPLLRMTRFWDTLQHFVVLFQQLKGGFWCGKCWCHRFCLLYKCSCHIQVPNETGNMSLQNREARGRKWSCCCRFQMIIWHGHGNRVLRSGSKSKDHLRTVDCAWFCTIGMLLYPWETSDFHSHLRMLRQLWGFRNTTQWASPFWMFLAQFAAKMNWVGPWDLATLGPWPGSRWCWFLMYIILFILNRSSFRSSFGCQSDAQKVFRLWDWHSLDPAVQCIQF